jgi:hypothetical protein
VETTKTNSLQTADSLIFYYRCDMSRKNTEWAMEGRTAFIIHHENPVKFGNQFNYGVAYFSMKDGTVRVVEGHWHATTTRCGWTKFETTDMTVEDARVHYANALKGATGKCEFTVPKNDNFI